MPKLLHASASQALPPSPPQAPEPTVDAGHSRGLRISLKGRALRLLAGREHSRAELERKLAAHTTDPEELSRVLDELQAKGYISQERLLESILHSRAARLGSARIERELMQRGLDRQAIDQALHTLQGTELERAQALWARKFKQTASDPRDRARQIRFLIGRGFSAEVARKVTG